VIFPDRSLPTQVPAEGAVGAAARHEGSAPSRAAVRSRQPHWSIAVARELVRLAEAEEGSHPLSDLWSELATSRPAEPDGALRRPVRGPGTESTVLAGERLHLDTGQVELLLVQSVMGLPESDRALVLGHFRDRRSLAELGAASGGRGSSTSARAVSARAVSARAVSARATGHRLREVLGELGGDLRQRCGGSAAVTLAALQSLVDSSGGRHGAAGRGWFGGGRALGRAAAAAALLLLILGGWWTAAWRGAAGNEGPTVLATEAAPGGREALALAPESSSAPAAPTTALALGSELPNQLRARERGALLNGVVHLRGEHQPEPGRSYLGVIRASSEGQEHRALIGVDGLFSLPGLVPGTWRLLGHLYGLESIDGEVVITAGVEPPLLEFWTQPAARIPVEVVSRLERRGIYAEPGYSDDWALLHGLSVVLHREAPGARLSEALVGQDQRLSRLGWFDRLDPIDMGRPAAIGTLVVERPARARWVSLVFGEYVIDSQPWLVGTAPLRFEFEPEQMERLRGEVSLMLRSLLGLDVTGARIVLYGPNGQRLERRLLDGSLLSLEGLSPGSWSLEIELPGHGRLRRSFELEPGGDLDLDALEMGPPLRVRGHVVDLAGNAIGADVWALDLEQLLSSPEQNGLQTFSRSLEHNRGSFDFGEALSQDAEWVLGLDHPNFALKAVKVVDGQTSVDLIAEVGETVQIHWSADQVQPGRLVLLRNEVGLPLKLMAIDHDLAQKFQLADGRYILELWEDGQWGDQLTFTVEGHLTKVEVQW
jgi:hypothetical protein